MGLPIRTTLDDIQKLCAYFASKPTGATRAEAGKILDSSYLDGRKISALKFWGLLNENESDGKIKITEDGRLLVKNGGESAQTVYRRIIARVPAYQAMVERIVHRSEESLTATDVAAHWHDHFKEVAGDADKTVNDQAVCFFQLAEGAKLGQLVVGRKGNPTRFNFDVSASRAVATGEELPAEDLADEKPANEGNLTPLLGGTNQTAAAVPPAKAAQLGQGIFIAHGKNKKPLEQLKRILDQFKIPYKVAIEEPNLGRPISAKVKETMEACNCAVLIFTADEEFRTADDKVVWRPSENVVYELGASGYLYGNRMVILKENDVSFPTNFRDLCYISFDKDQVEAKAMDIIKELIGFGILRVSV